MDKIFKLQTHQEAQSLFGLHDVKAQLIEKEFKVKLTLRGEHLKVSGTAANIKKAAGLIEYLLNAYRLGQDLAGKLDLTYLIANFRKPKGEGSLKIPQNGFTHISSGKQIGPKTSGQREYVESIKGNDIVFGIGPAGTGKTYIGIAIAKYLLEHLDHCQDGRVVPNILKFILSEVK